uniref:Uncharacterized protein n=1 Tax=Thermogemmatispora argillosa TaxID=2045280 RepID=A0A455T6K2_9CHLR|nr:hypothetical protein KTA_33600 [Thermogemmatispora argillosa]
MLDIGLFLVLLTMVLLTIGAVWFFYEKQIEQAQQKLDQLLDEWLQEAREIPNQFPSDPCLDPSGDADRRTAKLKLVARRLNRWQQRKEQA